MIAPVVVVGDGSNVSWLDGSVYGEQVSGQAYFGGGGYSGDYTGSQTNGKGNGLPGTGGGGTLGGIGRGGMIAIYSSVGLGIKYIGFDTYNKLSLSGITNPTSKLHALPTGAESTTTYDIGTATNIYIESEGTYTAEMKGSDAFALDSTVVNTITNLNSYTNTKGVHVGSDVNTAYYAKTTSTFSNNILIGDKNYSVSYWINVTASALSQAESAHIWWGNYSANNVMRLGFRDK